MIPLGGVGSLGRRFEGAIETVVVHPRRHDLFGRGQYHNRTLAVSCCLAPEPAARVPSMYSSCHGEERTGRTGRAGRMGTTHFPAPEILAETESYRAPSREGDGMSPRAP